jgi:hypothetical protein
VRTRKLLRRKGLRQKIGNQHLRDYLAVEREKSALPSLKESDMLDFLSVCEQRSHDHDGVHPTDDRRPGDRGRGADGVREAEAPGAADTPTP